MTTDARWLDTMPQIYDRCLGPALFAPFAAELAECARRLGPDRLLELAAGTGIVTRGLVRALPDADIVATDLNPAMVSFGSQRVPEATWQAADALDLPFLDNRFDLVACQFGVMFFPDRPAGFAETARVLRPGGTALFATWDVVDASDFAAAFTAALATVLPDGPPDFLTRVPHGYTDVDRIASDVRAGGLDEPSIARVVLTGRAESTRGLAEGFCLGTPVAFGLQERGDLAELTEAIATELVARLGEGPIEGELSAYLITATKPA